MIRYAEDMEYWYDESDSDFVVSMTPESGGPYPEFENRHDFWRWYSNDPECQDFNNIKEFLKWCERMST